MFPSKLSHTAIVAVCLSIPAGGAAAAPQEGRASTNAEQSTRSGSAQRAHDDRDAIIVTGVRRREQDVLGGISVLDRDELTREVRPSIGETLARQPGVSATSFGPTASAPVLRGLTGDRVRVLTDGTGSLDLSSSGPDHAIAINPVTAERIEVLRGPSALLFGSSAIGGVVNVIDTRIPRHEAKGAVRANGLIGYGTAADERLANGGIDIPLARHFILHFDGNSTKTGNLETGGHILSKDLRDQASASPAPEIRALADLEGGLPNSAGKSTEGAIGLGFVDGGLNIGLSVTRHEARYQVPIRYSLDPAVDPEAPTIDQEQTRYDLRAEIPVQGFFSHIRARGGYAKYHHDELEESGEVGSSFYSEGGEARLELNQSKRGGWEGASGLQYLNRDARIRGEEKFLPDSRQRQAGIFTLQSLVSGPWRLEAGARVEFSRLSAEADDQLGTPARSRNFTAFSGSLGGQYEFSPGWRAGLTVSSSARAPSIDELFANGPHGASQSFEVGDPELDAERSLGIEASLHRSAGPLRLTANAYFNHFSNFIFQAPTGAMEDDLPVFQILQGRANYYGFEAQVEAELGKAFGIDWRAEIQADAVHATVKRYGPAPLIPPLRVLGGFSGSRGAFDGRVEIEHAFDHDRTAPIETNTAGYTLVNASFDWHAFETNPALTFALSVNNLFDVVARRSTSMLKDFAPLAGRDIRLTARLGL